MMRFWQERKMLILFVFSLLLTACAAPSENDKPEDIAPAATAVPGATETPVPIEPTTPSPTNTPAATETAVPSATDMPEPEPTATAASAEPTAIPDPLLPIGSTANWTETNDIIGIEGEIEFTSATQLVIRNFVFLAAEAPGVDIRLGVGDDFSEDVGVSLRDITGKTYEGRSLTLTLPAEAFDGRSFDSIGVFCFDTGDLFDYALIQTP